MAVHLRICVLLVLVVGLNPIPQPLSAAPAPPDEKGVLARFTVEKGGDWLLVPVSVKGKKYDFLLDTGCAQNVFDPKLLPGGARDVATFLGHDGGQVVLNVFDAPDATFGGFRLGRKDPVIAFDFEKMREKSGHEVFGCVGMPFLKHHVVRIDFDAGEVVFLRSVGERPGEKFPLTVDKYGTLWLRAKVPDWGEEWFLVDTGGGGTMIGFLQEALFDKLLAKRKLKPLGEGGFETVAGTETHRFGQIRGFGIGDFALQDTVVGASDQNLLGLGFLSHFIVTFDFPNNAVYLKKGKRFDRPETPPAGIGLTVLRKNGQAVADSVEEGSAADAAGFQAGDILVEVDGTKVAKLRFFKLHQMMSAAGKPIRVTVRRDEKELKVTLDPLKDLISRLLFSSTP